MLANIVIEYFQRGGLVMWPILICAVVLVAAATNKAITISVCFMMV